MKTRLQKPAVALVLSLALVLTGCAVLVGPSDSESLEKVNEQIRESIEKTFPLPEQVVIRTHVGDDLRFSTELSVEEVLAFYRDAYGQQGYVEAEDSQVLTDSAALIFVKDGAKDVVLEVTESENGSDVHIQLK